MIAGVYLALALAFRLAVRRRSSTSRSPADDPRVRLIDVYYLLLAARWTLALTGHCLPGRRHRRTAGRAAARLALRPAALARRGLRQGRPGHAAAGLAVRLLLRLADLRRSPSRPGSRRRSPSRSMPAPSWARSGAAACRRSRARSGRPARRSASASPSSCATSSCRRRCASPSRRPSASSCSSSRTRRWPP